MQPTPEPETRRERKRQATRDAIVAAAFALFAERGFEAVSVSEITERADVARATFFSHFPTKESVVLQFAADDDPAAIVAGRDAGERPLRALRRFYLALAAGEGAALSPTLPPEAGGPDLLLAVRVIAGSQTLSAGVRRLRDEQERTLAQELATAVGDDGAASTMAAAQICAVIAALQARFFDRLAAGTTFEEALAALPAEVELAFDQLERGLGHFERTKRTERSQC